MKKKPIIILLTLLLMGISSLGVGVGYMYYVGAYTLWQYTDRGQINGILHPVDLCKFNTKYSLEHIKIK